MLTVRVALDTLRNKVYTISLMTTVYTLPVCQQCNMTKRSLTQKGIEFESVDLSTAPDHIVQGFKDKGLMAAPIVVTDNDAWSGFRPDKIALI